MLMIEPPLPASTIAWPNTWQAKNTLVRSISRMRCHSASPISKKGVPEFTPAAFNRMSTWPKRPRTVPSASSRLVLLVASEHTPMAPRPRLSIERARASAPSLLTSRMAISAPASAKPVAIAPARTPPPPITTATWPVSEKNPLSDMPRWYQSDASAGAQSPPESSALLFVPHQRPVDLAGDGLRQRPRILRPRHRQRLPADQAMPRHAEQFQKTALPAQRKLRQHRVPETRLHQALDGFRIVGLHDHPRRNPQLAEEGVDTQTHVAARRIEQKRRIPQLFRLQLDDLGAAGAPMGRTQPQQLLLKQRQNSEFVLGNGHGEQAQIEPPRQQAGDDFLGLGHRHQNLVLRNPAAQQAQRLAQTVDQ